MLTAFSIDKAENLSASKDEKPSVAHVWFGMQP